jgi:hypothetical protein
MKSFGSHLGIAIAVFTAITAVSAAQAPGTPVTNNDDGQEYTIPMYTGVLG